MNFPRLAALVLTLGLASGAAACADEDDSDGEGAAPGPAGAAAPGLSGELTLETDVVLPATVLAPADVAALFDDLRATRDDPAGTWFALLEHAGVPQAKRLVGALPSVLADRVEGWIDETVAAELAPGKPKRTQLDAIIDEATQMIGRFDFLSTLTIPPTADAAVARHAFTGLRFELGRQGVTVPVPRFVVSHARAVVLEPEASVRLRARPGGEAGLEISDHAFGLPFGEYVWAGIEVRQRQRGGADLRSELGRLFDCPGLALSVSKKCVGPLCVGHKAELQEVCERGLDQVVESVKAKVVALDFAALRFASGSAALVRAPRPAAATDGRIDALASGVWEATVDVGGGPRRVEASFVGQRR